MIGPRPGQELMRILNIPVTPQCLCYDRAKHMDVMGCRWCRDNRFLIVDWMHEEYLLRVCRFHELIESRNEATEQAVKDQLNGQVKQLGVPVMLGVVVPFSHVVMRRVVTIAIKRAERQKAKL